MVMKAVLSVALAAIALVNRVRADTVQLPIYGSGASYYEHYAHNSDPEDPNYCDPYQTNYTGSRCFNLVEYLTIQVEIGNPEQKLNLTIDSFADDVFVFSDGAADTKCLEFRGNGSPVQGRRLFRSSRSTTFRGSGLGMMFADDDQFFQDNCPNAGPNDDPEAEALVGSDDFKVGGKSARKVPFLVVKSVQPTVQSFWPSDGVFSMSQRDLSETRDSAVYRVASSVGQPQTTLYLKRTSGYPSGGRVGTLTFGGRDAKNCDQTWTDLPLGTPNLIAFNTKVSSVSLGSTDVYKNVSVASFLIGSPTIGVPFSMFPVIGAMLNASFDPKTQFYVIPCGSVKDAPPLTFHMEGVNYVIPAVDYIRNLVPRSDGMCTVLTEIQGETVDIPNGQKVEEWDLGLPAMRSFCWNFDFDTNLVSVAKAIQDV